MHHVSLMTFTSLHLSPVVMFLDGRQPVKYGLKMEMDEKYQQLKVELEKLCGVPASRLLLVDVYASNIRVSGF